MEKILTNDVLPSILNKWLVKNELQYRGLVKWYDRGLQNLWWEFDSLIPCASNGMIGVSKTFGGSSILSSPARKAPCFTVLFLMLF